MIFVGIGGNLATAAHGSPLATCKAAVAAVGRQGVVVVACSRWYLSRPVPLSNQPDFVNAVAAVATELDPLRLLDTLHRIEAAFGRRRGVRDAARTVDLDLLAYGAEVRPAESGVVLPHPRLHQRRFVLAPLAELAPAWRHPRLGRTTLELLADAPADQVAEPLEESSDRAID
ncbi:MAG: 2-amino-4-hydroxy-6-hydroxymethyldihydropteridine diphosphokinase [Rhodospirillales bacterium]|nr:MAG: 2-amino-4-hydroxy-6-hydroxymethyldihydropteridine diphosphokinase [Rhodospirillales bacterium]